MSIANLFEELRARNIPMSDWVAAVHFVATQGEGTSMLQERGQRNNRNRGGNSGWARSSCNCQSELREEFETLQAELLTLRRHECQKTSVDVSKVPPNQYIEPCFQYFLFLLESIHEP